MHKPKILVITGPTASGKTDLSLQLAQRYNGEIINADMGQLYEALSIGTAKPDLSNVSVPHHLFNVVNEPKNFTVLQYRLLVLDKINQLLKIGKLPILVGGSFFYLKSLFFPPQELGAGIGNALPDYHDFPNEALWNELRRIDEKRASDLHSNDRYRVLRALMVWNRFHKKPSDCLPTFDFPFQTAVIHLHPEINFHKEIIASRVQEMLQHGWILEACALLGTSWEFFILEKKIIGYSELFSWIRAGSEEEQLLPLAQVITQKTWQYARRQLIFWKSFKKQLAEVIDGKIIELSFTQKNKSQLVVKSCDFVEFFLKKIEK